MAAKKKAKKPAAKKPISEHAASKVRKGVRVKFTCSGSTHSSSEAALIPVEAESPENGKAFSGAARGAITLTGLGSDAFHYFQPGEEYFVDFVKV